jgi:hypothetical protein
MNRHHDAEIGVNWDVIDTVAAELFGYAPETDEEEDEDGTDL